MSCLGRLGLKNDSSVLSGVQFILLKRNYYTIYSTGSSSACVYYMYDHDHAVRLAFIRQLLQT